MQNLNSRSGQRETRTKATQQPHKKPTREEDTPAIRQRIANARRTNRLDLRCQNLELIPTEASKLGPQITQLLLGSNKLSTLPANFTTQFPNLVYLDLSHNLLSSKVIPNSLVEIEGLKVIDLEGNKEIRNIPHVLSGSDIVVIVNSDTDRDVEFGGERTVSGDDDVVEERYEVKAYLNDGTYHSDEEDESAFDEENEEFDEDEDEEELHQEKEFTFDFDAFNDDQLPLEARLFFEQLVNGKDLDEEILNLFRQSLVEGDEELGWYLTHRFRLDDDVVAEGYASRMGNGGTKHMNRVQKRDKIEASKEYKRLQKNSVKRERRDKTKYQDFGDE